MMKREGDETKRAEADGEEEDGLEEAVAGEAPGDTDDDEGDEEAALDPGPDDGWKGEKEKEGGEEEKSGGRKRAANLASGLEFLDSSKKIQFNDQNYSGLSREISVLMAMARGTGPGDESPTSLPPLD